MDSDLQSSGQGHDFGVTDFDRLVLRVRLEEFDHKDGILRMSGYIKANGEEKWEVSTNTEDTGSDTLVD